jgi:hypothetical protein
MEMSRYLAVSVLSLVFACSAGPSTPQESPMPPKLETLDAQLLRDCVEMGGSVALIRVREVKASQAGTRGARVRVEFELEQALHGSIPRQAGFWSFGGPTTAQVGQKLIAAFKPGPADAKDVGLLAFVPVPVGQEAESVRLHREPLAALGK